VFCLCGASEVHHVSAPTFSQALLRVNAPVKIGLSATPIRKDGLTRVIEYFLGPIFFKIERENQAQVRVETIVYEGAGYKEAPPTTRFGKVSLPNVINSVCEDGDRTTLIVQRVKELAAVGRRIIVLTDRREHCRELVEAIQSTGVSAGLYVGGMKPAALTESEACTVIVGTFSLANEGLDIPHLDTIVLASPKSDVVQATGRILREGFAKKHPPLIVDLHDKWACLTGQYYKRRRFYKEAGFHLGHVDVQEEAPSNTLDEFSFRV